jgi:polyphosphate kinase
MNRGPTLPRVPDQTHIADLFPGFDLDGVHAFRVTRNSDLYIDDEEAENLLRTIE